jgi:hypothetical protein
MEQSKEVMDYIQRDKYFLIIDNQGSRRFTTLNMKKVRMGKKEIHLDFFENKPLNTFWQIDEGNQFIQISHKEFFSENIGDRIDKDYVDIIKSTNKEIYSEGSQKLTADDIQEMKERGVKGDEIIKTIMESNTSTEKRTLFSQEKIMKKKDKIHNHRFWFTNINLYNVIETYFHVDDPKKIKYFNN